MLSRPDSSGWKPEPTSSIAAIRPWWVMVPSLGYRILAMHFRRVDFPDPLSPTRANVEPRGTCSETSRSAQKSSWTDLRRRRTADFRVVLRSA